MAMHGKDGKILIGANEGTDLDSWSINTLGGQRFDNTPLQNTWRTRLNSQLEATGNITFNWDTTDTNVQGALLSAAVAGSTVTLKLYVNASNYFSIPAYINLGVEVKKDDVVLRTFTFESHGTVSFN